MKLFLEDLLNFHEVTTCNRDKKAYVDAHRLSCYEVDWFLVDILIRNDVLDVDCGNWETGERHYTLDESFYGLDKLERILELKEIINREISRRSSNDDNYVKLLENLLILEKKEERKQKLNKIYEK